MKRKIAAALALVGLCASQHAMAAKYIQQLYLKCTYSGMYQSGSSDPVISKDDIEIYKIRNGYIAAWNPLSGNFERNKCESSNEYQIFEKQCVLTSEKFYYNAHYSTKSKDAFAFTSYSDFVLIDRKSGEYIYSFSSYVNGNPSFTMSYKGSCEKTSAPKLTSAGNKF